MKTPANIKVLALDVDGVLTDGTITFGTWTKKEIKTFHVHDGMGISLWQKAGNHVVLLSGRNAECVKLRAKELGIKYVHQGSLDKIADLEATLAKLEATAEQTCFVGDDLGDMPVMQHVGYSIAVHNAAQEVRQTASWTTTRNGGRGAVREAIEHLMKANDTWETAVSSCQKEPVQQ